MNIYNMPHSKEAEQCAIGCALISQEAWEEMSQALTVESFYEPLHKSIFEAMQGISQRGAAIDFILVSEELNNKNAYLDYLTKIIQSTSTPENIKFYIEIIESRKTLRDVIKACNEAIQIATTCKDDEVKESLDVIESKFFQISNQLHASKDTERVKEILPRVLESIEANYYHGGVVGGLDCGFSQLDTMTSGFKGGELIILAARPAMGKTTFAMNMAEHISVKSKKPVVVFSMEMSSESLVLRMLSSLSLINNTELQSGKFKEDGWLRLTSAVGIATKSKLYIDDSPALSLLDIRAKCRRLMKKEPDLSLVVIDYLQLMSSEGKQSQNRNEEIASISRGLKALSKELNIPIVALSQLNRALETRPNRRPIMSDLRDSGSIEQDADVVMFVYRDEVYNPDTTDSRGIAEIIIGKQRNGPVGTVRVRFEGHVVKFSNLCYEQFD